MWQRVQTIFLAIANLCLLAMIFFPIWEGTNGSETVTLYPFYLKTESADIYSPYFAVAILAIAAITVGVIEVMKYQNRMTQIKLGALNSLLMAGTLVMAVIYVRNLQASYTGTFGISLFLPAIAMVCNSIANRFIRRDERLVRESDRLR